MTRRALVILPGPESPGVAHALGLHVGLDVHLVERPYAPGEEEPEPYERILTMAYVGEVRVLRALLDGTDSKAFAWLREDLEAAANGAHPVSVVLH